MKKYNLFKVVMIVILLLVLGSWFIPSSSVDTGAVVTGEYNRTGLFQLFLYFLTAVVNFAPLMFYVLIVGGLYGVLNKIPAYRRLLDKVVNLFKGFEYLFMAIVMVLFAVLTSMVGMSMPIIILFPFVISVILLMGYDKITAALVTVGSIAAGLVGTVFSAGVVQTIAEYTQVASNTNVGYKIILLVVALAIVFINVVLYSRKHHDKKNLVGGILVPEKTTSKSAVWPIVVILDAVLIVIGLGFFSWHLFEINVFKDITTAFVNPTGGTKGIFTALNAILGIGESQYFGNWGLIEAGMLVLMASGIIAFIYRKKFDEFLDNFKDGFKLALKPAFLVGLIYTIVIVVSRVQNEFTIVQHLVSFKEGVNIFTMIPVAIIFVILGVETLYGAALAGPYIASAAGQTVVASSIVTALLWQAIGGFAVIFAPTSVILMITLSYLNISYGKWLKATWPMILELLVAITGLLLIFQTWFIK